MKRRKLDGAGHKIKSSEHKKGPKNIEFGDCGHEIKPIQRSGKMLWHCESDGYVKHAMTKLVPRKGK